MNSKLNYTNLSDIFAANTDTIPGVFANIHNDICIQKIYQIKCRSYNKPLALYASNIELMLSVIAINNNECNVIQEHYNDQTTFIIPLRAKLPLNNRLFKDGNVGIRLPQHDNFRKGGIMYNAIFCGTSANISGSAEKLNIAISGSQQPGSGIPSKIIDIANNKVLYR